SGDRSVQGDSAAHRLRRVARAGHRGQDRSLETRVMGPRTSILIHIGAHKTGTTSIQQTFSAHADDLLRGGLLYPASGRLPQADLSFGHHGLSRAVRALAQGNTSGGGALDDLLGEIETKQPERVVISSEEFWALPDP